MNRSFSFVLLLVFVAIANVALAIGWCDETGCTVQETVQNDDGDDFVSSASSTIEDGPG